MTKRTWRERLEILKKVDKLRFPPVMPLDLRSACAEFNITTNEYYIWKEAQKDLTEGDLDRVLRRPKSHRK